MIPDMVLNATVYAHLTQLLEISNYRVASAEIVIDIAISTKNYAYSINSVRFVVAQLFHVFCRSEFARDKKPRFGDRSYNLLDGSLRKS